MSESVASKANHGVRLRLARSLPNGSKVARVIERAETKIGRDLLEAVRERAGEEGRDSSEIIEEAVSRYLSQARNAVPLAFLLNLFGTALPVMVFIYCILLPRFLKLTGSVAATVVLGDIAYAAIHFFESWTAYDTVANGVLSGIFLMFQYFGPGMIKSVLTLRMGNAWVHVWAYYHAIAPHVTVDTTNIVNVFRLSRASRIPRLLTGAYASGLQVF